MDFARNSFELCPANTAKRIKGNNVTIIKRSIFLLTQFKNMIIKGNFIGAAVVTIIYTVYILWHPLPAKWQMAVALVILNALTIVLMAFAFKQ